MKHIERHRISEASVTGVTATCYSNLDDGAFDTGLNTARRWHDLGLPLVVVDASPDVDTRKLVAEAFRARGAAVLSTRQSDTTSQLQEGVRCVLRVGGDNAITHDLEQPSMPEVATEIAEKIVLNSYPIAVIGRTDKSKGSMHPFQRRTEELGGWVLEHVIRLPADALAGPRGYSYWGMRQFIKCSPGETGLGSQSHMYDAIFAAWSNGGCRVGGVKVDLMYPGEQVRRELNNPDFKRKCYDKCKTHLGHFLQKSRAGRRGIVVSRAMQELLAHMPERPTDAQIEKFFDKAEARLQRLGYKPR